MSKQSGMVSSGSITGSAAELPKALIEARGIRKSFGAHEVLRGVDLSATKGSVVTLIGSSGSGKSTFVRCLNFLEEPTAGEVIVGGEVFRPTSDRGHDRQLQSRLVRLRRRVGMVFQSFNLWPHRTAIGNVMEGLVQVLKLPSKEAEERALGYLTKVGLAEKAHAFPSQLSGGQQQRVAIARALAMEPDVVLFDEPTSALDPELVGEVLRVIQELAAEGRTMVFVTHEMQLARDVSTETLFLAQGEVMERGPPEVVFGSPRTQPLRNFLARYSN